MQPDAQEKADAAANLLEDFAGNGLLHRIEPCLEWSLMGIEPLLELAQRHGGEIDQRLTAHADGTRLRIEALSAASRAGDHAHVFLKLQAARSGRGLLEAGDELRDDAFPLGAVFPDPATAHPPLESDVPITGAVQKPVAVLRGQLLPGCLDIDV